MAKNQAQTQAVKRVSPLAELTPEQRKKYYINWILDNLLYIILIVLLIVSVATIPSLRKVSRIFQMITFVAQYLPLACGIAGCIVLTGTDLSAGRIVGFTALMTAIFMQSTDAVKKLIGVSPLPIPITFIIVLAVGFAIGSVNGFFVAKFKLHPFLVTLGTQLIIYGGSLTLSQINGNNSQPISSLDTGFKNFVAGHIFNFGNGIYLQWFVLYAAIFVAIIWFLWNKTRFGKNMFAVGSNPEAANVSGVNVAKTIILVHALAGLAYAYTGFIDSARLASNVPNTGLGYELDGIAASVIGGVSFIGGIGKISGVILGVFLLQFISIFLSAVGLTSGDVFNVIKGAIIILACTLDMRKYVVAK